MRSELMIGPPLWLRFLAALFLLLSGCSERTRFAEGLTLGDGTVIDPATLRRGEVVYVQSCAACHGVDGDANGMAAAYMRPVPRAFRQGLFKFGGVAGGELPTDEALERVVRRGLQGTPMLGWELPASDRRAVVQYLKTFSPRWKEEPPGEPITLSPDPWKGRESEAVTRGRALFHVSGAGHAGCIGCHPAYLPREELGAMVLSATGRSQTKFAEDLHRGRTRDSDHALHLDDAGESLQNARIYATDFLTQPLRTVWPVGARVDGAVYTSEQQREDLYRVIAAGIGGTAMPTWKNALPEESLWALVHYVQSVMGARDTAEGRALRARLAADDADASAVDRPDAG